MRRKYGIIIFCHVLGFWNKPDTGSHLTFFYVLDEILNEVKEHAVERRKNCNHRKQPYP